MGDKDETRGRALAELARRFLLWLPQNEVAEFPGLKELPLNRVALSAGVYRRIEGDLPTLPEMMMSSLSKGEDTKRAVVKHALQVSHLIMMPNIDDMQAFPPMRYARRNAIVPKGMEAITETKLEYPDALMTVAPLLDSLKADALTRATAWTQDLLAVDIRADMVWDMRKSAPAGFKYGALLDYDVPREMYRRNVQHLDPPEEIFNRNPAAFSRNFRKFVDYLRSNATYRQARRRSELVLEGDGNEGEGDGTYYAKYRGDPNLEPKSHDFTAGNLSDEYILDSVFQPILKRDASADEGYVLIEAASGKAIYRLTVDTRKPAAESLEATLVFDAVSGSPDGKKPKVTGVHCLFFNALDGGDKLPGLRGRRRPDRYVVPSGRVLLDYRAYVRWYYGQERLNIGADEDWLDMFVETFFSDELYPVRLDGLVPEVRERLLDHARKAVQDAEEPFKSRLQEVLAKMESERDYGFLMRGDQFGPRQLIGVTYNGDYPDSVVEWSPDSGVVTRMPFLAWLQDVSIGNYAAEVYRNTAGMIPIIMIVVWGSVGVMGAAIIAPAAMGALARGAVGITIRQFAANKVAGKVAREALKKLAPQLAAVLAEYLSAMLPRSNSLYIVGLRGFLHGFGSGTLSHYLSEVDERLEKGVKTFAKAVVNRLTKGAYHVAMVLMKVTAAIRKLRALYKGLMTVYTDERAKLVAQQLDKLWRHAGTGFLVVLFVVIYVDFAYRRKFKPEEWVVKQRNTFVWMVKKTGREVADYADALRAEIKGLQTSLDEQRARDEKLSAKFGEAVREGVSALPAVGDLVEGMLGELGITNWQQLKEMKFLDALQVGIDEFVKQHPDIKEAAAREIGSALGGFVGGIILGRKMVPESVRKQSTMFKPTVHKGVKEALAEGTFSGLWQLARAPIEALIKAIGVSLTQKRKVEDARAGAFRKTDRRKPGYAKFVQDLWNEHENIGHLLWSLASEEGLGDQVRALVLKVSSPDAEMPSIEKMLEVDDPEWPRKAVLFVLLSWLYHGLDQMRAMFGIIEDDDLFGGKMSLADILEIIGLDVRLDDKLAEAMKAKFLRKP